MTSIKPSSAFDSGQLTDSDLSAVSGGGQLGKKFSPADPKNERGQSRTWIS
jgi:hypothetical protein